MQKVILQQNFEDSLKLKPEDGDLKVGVMCGFENQNNIFITSFHEINIMFNYFSINEERLSIDSLYELNESLIESFCYHLYNVLIGGLSIVGFYVVSANNTTKIQSIILPVISSLNSLKLQESRNLLLLHYESQKLIVKLLINNQFISIQSEICSCLPLEIKEYSVPFNNSWLIDSIAETNMNLDLYKEILKDQLILNPIHLPQYPHIYKKITAGYQIQYNSSFKIKLCIADDINEDKLKELLIESIIKYLKYLSSSILPSNTIAYDSIKQIELNEPYFLLNISFQADSKSFVHSLLGPEFNCKEVINETKLTYVLNPKKKTVKDELEKKKLIEEMIKKEDEILDELEKKEKERLNSILQLFVCIAVALVSIIYLVVKKIYQ